MIVLDSKILLKFLDAAVDRLDGEWILLGGTLLPALGRSEEHTSELQSHSLSRMPSSA